MNAAVKLDTTNTHPITEGNVTYLFPTSNQRPTHTPNECSPLSEIRISENLKTVSQVFASIDYFINRNDYRYAALLVCGYNTGLRISDLVALKFSDIFSSLSPLTFREYINIREQKTGKRSTTSQKVMLVTEAMRLYLTDYVEHLDIEPEMDLYLFTTQKTKGLEPMNRNAANRAMKEAFSYAAPELHCGTHTMRRTFANMMSTLATHLVGGYNPAMQDVIRMSLNHSSIKTTKLYTGVHVKEQMLLQNGVSNLLLGRYPQIDDIELCGHLDLELAE